MVVSVVASVVWTGVIPVGFELASRVADVGGMQVTDSVLKAADSLASSPRMVAACSASS